MKTLTTQQNKQAQTNTIKHTNNKQTQSTTIKHKQTQNENDQQPSKQTVTPQQNDPKELGLYTLFRQLIDV